jgi:outer membrane protein insertion porin family
LKRLRVLPLLLLLNIVTFASSQVRIDRIEISGNRNVSEQRILLLMKTKTGGEFNEEVLKEDVRSLVETGFFSDVRYSTEEGKAGVIVRIYVVEKPVIRDIQFAGNRVFSGKKLKEFLGVNKGDILDEVKILGGIEEIKTKYREKRFYLTEISYEIENGEESTVKILIDEKGRGYVKNLMFAGNNSFSSSRLKRLMKIKQRKMPFIRGTFKEDLFSKDIERVKNFYRERGFLDIKIKSNISADEKSRLLNVQVTVDEGKQYHLGNIKFKGDTIFDEAELISLLILKEKGEIFSRKRADENFKNLVTFYVDRGYLRGRVEEVPMIGERSDVMDITYFIEPGMIYHAGEIIVRGNTKTKDKVIRREVKIEPGDKITSDGMRKSFNNLFDLNYFEKIDIYPEFAKDSQTANVVVDVEEKGKTGIFLIGGGYSSVDDLIGVISVQQTNFDITNPPSFTGGGQNLTFTTELGTEAQNFRLSFTEPYFLDKPVWFGADLYSTKREWTDYTDERIGGALRFGRRWENISLGFTVRVEEVTLSDIDITSIAGQEGDNNMKNSITTSFAYSNLDSKRSPKKGILSRMSLEYAGGVLQGDIDFIKPIFENNFYYPFKNLTFHSRTYAGMVREVGDTDDVPIYERFFGGGIGTVRGYEERSLGPDEDGIPLGGESLFAQNLELIYPLYEDILKGVLFFDAGNVWEDWGEFGSLRKSVGAGVRLMVPLFNAPVEIYYGYALDEKPGEPQGRWHFGMSFGF